MTTLRIYYRQHLKTVFELLGTRWESSSGEPVARSRAARPQGVCAIVSAHLVPRAGSKAGGVKRETGKRLHIAAATRANHAKHEAAKPVLSPQRSRGERNEACFAQCVQGHCLPSAGGKANAMSRQPGYRPVARGRESHRHSLEPRETDTSAHARRKPEQRQPSRVTRNIA